MWKDGEIYDLGFSFLQTIGKPISQGDKQKVIECISPYAPKDKLNLF